MNFDENTYIFKGDQSTSGANFNLEEMRDAFSFEDICSHPIPDSDTEAAIVITGKQYVASYTADGGSGVHMGLYARIMKDLQGGGEIRTQREEILLSGELQRKYIVARIDYATATNEIGRINYRNGTIAFFNLHRTDLSLEEIAQFENFYREYVEAINYACSKYGFHIRYTFLDENGVTSHKDTDNLEEVLAYVQSRIPFAKSVNHDDEVMLTPGLGTRG